MVLLMQTVCRLRLFDETRVDLSCVALSREFVENAVRLLVTRLIPLRTSDLQGWISDPEEWVNVEEKEDEQWEFELRVRVPCSMLLALRLVEVYYDAQPCSERVLMTLANQYGSFVTPLLAASFKQIMGKYAPKSSDFLLTGILVQPVVDLPAVIQKEALYCAIGRCSTHLKDVIPFQGWLTYALASEVRENNARSVLDIPIIPIDHSHIPVISYPIIKRRIAWLIGKWVNNMCARADSPAIWEVLVHLLRDRGPGTDAVVRFTAATVVKICVDVSGITSAVIPFPDPYPVEHRV